MHCALESASFGFKKMQRIQNRSLLLICIRVRGLFRFFVQTFFFHFEEYSGYKNSFGSNFFSVAEQLSA